MFLSHCQRRQDLRRNMLAAGLEVCGGEQDMTHDAPSGFCDQREAWLGGAVSKQVCHQVRDFWTLFYAEGVPVDG